jgi:hypothetical protein
MTIGYCPFHEKNSTHVPFLRCPHVPGATAPDPQHIHPTQRSDAVARLCQCCALRRWPP